jgi:hypothetical protein
MSANCSGRLNLLRYVDGAAQKIATDGSSDPGESKHATALGFSPIALMRHYMRT